MCRWSNVNKIVLMSAILFLTVSLSSVYAQETMSEPQIPEEATYKLGKGDKINILVWKNPEFSRELTISPNGRINYPFIGEISTAGMTVMELQKDIQEKLVEHIKHPQVTVTLLEAYNFRVYVLGQVLRPNVYQLKGPITVVQALAMAGGFTPYADRDSVVVVNPLADPSKRDLFNYNTFLDGSDKQQNVVLREGDTVLVP